MSQETQMTGEIKFPKLVLREIESRISLLLPFIVNVDGACHISSKSQYIDERFANIISWGQLV